MCIQVLNHLKEHLDGMDQSYHACHDVCIGHTGSKRLHLPGGKHLEEEQKKCMFSSLLILCGL